MLSPSVSVTSPEGASLPVSRSRRRGLSYLRNLSGNRSPGASGSDSSRTSPRSYFQRSISYTEPKNPPTNSNTRRRSSSRPNEPTSPLSDDIPGSQGTSTGTNGNRSSTYPNHTNSRRSRSAGSRREHHNLDRTEDSPARDMARRHPSSLRRTESSTQQGEASVDTSGDPLSRSGTATTRTTAGANGDAQEGENRLQLPTIRFFPHQEHRNGRQSLDFKPISRTLPGEHCIIRIGRYSEREGVPNANPITPSDAPVGFKSKVVSRKHCEFSFVDGQWHIKDVASSSGTFLNHIRLSQPSTESRLFPIKDGDIVQLGIDFRGGEEMIFRCVKMRIECNRAWQKKPNNFNKTRHVQLQNLAKDQVAMGNNSGECSICLGPVLPCQALFVAPCAHVWHYKCIRPLLEGKSSTFPQFQCPNCRAYSDLTADVDIAESDMDEWMAGATDSPDQVTSTADGISDSPQAQAEGSTSIDERNPSPVVANEPTADSAKSPTPSTSSLLARRHAANSGSSQIQPMNISEMPVRALDEETDHPLEEQITRTETPDAEMHVSSEGPLTPRNDAGPFVFDGSAETGSMRRFIVAPIPEVIEDRS